jgi:Spy/CpxP family protein refolding chaperone
MESSRQIKYQVWLLIVAVFTLGTVAGGALDRLYLSRSGALNPPRSAGGGRGPGRNLDQMATDLNLTDEQKQAIKKIFDESRKRDDFRQVMGQCPGMKEMREKHNSEIRALLNPDQQKRFSEILAEREKKFNGGLPPPPPPITH